MMQKSDYIIVGQGIAGTLMAFLLEQRGQRVLVIDSPTTAAASLVAAGTINPITGRKYVKSWRIDDLLPAAKQVYDDLGQALGVEAVRPVRILRALTTPEEENTWLSKSADPMVQSYIVDPADASECQGRLKQVLAFGELQGCLQVSMPKIIAAFRQHLVEQASLLLQDFDYDQLEITETGVRYGDHQAKGIIFCEGHSVRHNPFFRHIKWQPVKGEVLHIKIEGAPFKKIVRHRIFITHLHDDVYWVGARYIHQYQDDQPTAEERAYLVRELDDVLTVPYTVIGHKAGIRPAVSGRRPVVGPHPSHRHLYIFNGLGTKGASLGPFFAQQLTDYLLDGKPIDQEVERLLT